MTNTTLEDTGLHRPGTLFHVGGCDFMSRGTRGAPNGKLRVVRLVSGDTDTLSIPRLLEDYEDGNVTKLKTVPIDND
jgi:hypothetical protein